MYRPDVMQLRQFYSSPLGQLVRAQLVKAASVHWPDLHGDLLLGLGYPNPITRDFLRREAPETMCVVPAMPAQQGGLYWPSHRENRTVLIDEHQLPFADNVMNRVLLLHELEHVESEAPLLRELWRILTPGGRMLVVVPNRRTIWARSPQTPFSYGKPYTIAQLRETLCRDLFTLVHTTTDLFFWPSPARSMLKLSPIFQKIGSLLFPMMGGVIVMEVEKQIYASVRDRGQRVPVASYVPVPAIPGRAKI